MDVTTITSSSGPTITGPRTPSHPPSTCSPSPERLNLAALSHTWFVLHELLGIAGVKNYDGSWTEYGSLVGAPIELGDSA